MKWFVTYDGSGEIIARIGISDHSQAVNYPNRIDFDPTSISPEFDWKMKVVSGALVEKATVVISASKLSILADGIDEALLTFSGFSGSAVALVNGQRFPITPADPTLAITSDVPMAFRVRINDLDNWSPEIMIRAD